MVEAKIEGIRESVAKVMMNGAPDTTIPAAPSAPAATPAPATQPISTETAPSTGDKTAQAAPASGQPAEKPGESAKPPLPSSEQIAADAKKAEDDLKSALGMAESPEQKQQRLERDYAASSKEAKRLADESKKLIARLKDQGIDVANVNGVIDLVANSKYSKDASELEIKFKDLDEKSQELFVESPDKAIKLVLERAKQAFVRAMPTLDRAPAQVSSEREAEAVNFLSKETWTDGSLKHGDLAENIGLIQQIMTAPDASKAFKEFAASEPEKVREYLNLKIRAAKAFLKDSAQKVLDQKTEKEKIAAQTPPFGPASGGAASIGGGKSTDKGIGYQIARASMGY
jgi:hypothetical protein